MNTRQYISVVLFISLFLNLTLSALYGVKAYEYRKLTNECETQN